MQLRHIDKLRYRSHLNAIIVCSIAAFCALGVGFSALLIEVIGNPPGENFLLNLVGVGTAGVIAFWVLKSLKHTDYFREVAYVWDLKYELNLIHRKFAKIQKAAASLDRSAIICLLFHYEGSRQLWLLDDNVLNLQELEVEQLQFDSKIRHAGIDASAQQYSRELLEQF